VTLVASAAVVAAVLLTAVAVFQAALALGAPFGAYAWGGTNPGVLPQRLRIGSALSAPILLAMAVMILIGGGVVLSDQQRQMSLALWVVFLFMVLNTFANLRSKSPGERKVMTPVTAIVALATLVIQLAAS